MSHRGPEFESILADAENTLRVLLKIPPDYKVLFLQGGGTGQFAAVPLNLLPPDGTAAYIVSGGWSKKAAEEAAKYGKVHTVNPVIKSFTDIAPPDQWTIPHDASYLYYCDNETVYGVEFADVPDSQGKTLVADVSSNFLTRPINVDKYGLVYAGAQKNAGPAGVTVVIVREDLLGKARKECPSVFDYKQMADNNSMLNTPPCWSIYVMSLVFKWILTEGGVEEFARRAEDKSRLIYDTIDKSNGIYSCPVAVRVRSRVNIPFRVCRAGQPDPALEDEFLREAERAGMVSLKGHRSVGGIRASLYNALTMEQTKKLADFMKSFAAKHA